MVPRSSVEYLSRARKRDFTSPVIRSPFRNHTESVFCPSASPAASTKQRPASFMCTQGRSRRNRSYERGRATGQQVHLGADIDGAATKVQFRVGDGGATLPCKQEQTDAQLPHGVHR